MIFADHIRIVCAECNRGHKGNTCTHANKLQTGGLLFVVKDQGVGAEQNHSTGQYFTKPKPIDPEIKVRVVSAELCQDSNPLCELTGIPQFECKPRCKNANCRRSSIQNVFLQSHGLSLVRHKTGQDLPYDPEDPVENYLPSSVDIMARAGVSYRWTVNPKSTANYVTLEAKSLGMAKLHDAGDLSEHHEVSPYFTKNSVLHPFVSKYPYYDDVFQKQVVQSAKQQESQAKGKKKQSKQASSANDYVTKPKSNKQNSTHPVFTKTVMDLLLASLPVELEQPTQNEEAQEAYSTSFEEILEEAENVLEELAELAPGLSKLDETNNFLNEIADFSSPQLDHFQETDPTNLNAAVSTVDISFSENFGDDMSSLFGGNVDDDNVSTIGDCVI